MDIFGDVRDAWGKPFGTFIPPFVDVMIRDGAAFVWLTLTLEDDLVIERWGDETWGDPPPPSPADPGDPNGFSECWDVLLNGVTHHERDHEWLQYEVSMSGWEYLLDIPSSTMRPYEVITWALQNGIAPDQPFLVRIDIPHSYRCSYEYDEWDTDFNYEIVHIPPIPVDEAIQRWEVVREQMRCDRLLEDVKQDASDSLYNRGLPKELDTQLEALGYPAIK